MQPANLRNHKVLVVDDAPEAVELLRLILEGGGLRVIPAYCGLEALRAAFNHRPDVVLLDLMMPDMDGFTTGQRLREISDVPILVVSARGQVEDITRAFEIGADDYVVKPYERRELLARIHACLRRARYGDQTDGVISLCAGDLVIDPYRFRAMVRQSEIRLTRREFELLHYLARNRGRVLSHAMILEAVWGSSASASKDTLKQFMFSLRRKIEADPQDPQWLITEHGVGYALMADRAM